MGALLLAGTVSRYPTWSEKQLWSVGSRPQAVGDSGQRGPQFSGLLAPPALTGINRLRAPTVLLGQSVVSSRMRGGRVLNAPGQARVSSHSSLVLCFWSLKLCQVLKDGADGAGLWSHCCLTAGCKTVNSIQQRYPLVIHQEFAFWCMGMGLRGTLNISWHFIYSR